MWLGCQNIESQRWLCLAGYLSPAPWWSKEEMEGHDPAGSESFRDLRNRVVQAHFKKGLLADHLPQRAYRPMQPTTTEVKPQSQVTCEGCGRSFRRAGTRLGTSALMSAGNLFMSNKELYNAPAAVAGSKAEGGCQYIDVKPQNSEINRPTT